MTGSLWLPSLRTGAQFVVYPGEIAARFTVPYDAESADMEVALASVARALRTVAERTGPPITENTTCEAERFDHWGGATSRIEVRLYDRRAA